MIVRFAFRLAALTVLALSLNACGGGNSSNNPVFGNVFGSNGIQCDPGTQVQLANPTPGAFGVPTNFGQVIIVANGNSNTLYNTYANWQLYLIDNFGNQITSSNLSLVPFTNGPHPYQSDFYYAANIPTLSPGRTYNVLLNQFANCQPAPIGSFST